MTNGQKAKLSKEDPWKDIGREVALELRWSSLHLYHDSLWKLTQ